MPEVVWKLFPYQRGLFETKAPFILVKTGVGAGKTWAGARKAALKCLQWPGVNGLVAANSYKQLRRNVIPEFAMALDELNIAYRFLKTDSEFRVQVPVGDGRVVETTVIAFSMENFNDLRGYQLGWGWLDEGRDMVLEAFQVYVGRLRHPGITASERQTWITSTPNGFNWLHALFTDEDRAKSGKYVIFHGKTTDNRHLDEAYIEGMRSLYDEFMLKQEIEGEFINLAGGQLYYQFSRPANVSERVKYTPNAPLILSWDQNPNPLTCVVMQEKRKETWAIGEVVMRQGNIPVACEVLRERYHDHEAGIILCGDSVGTNPSAGTGKSDYQVIRECLSVWYRGRIVEDVDRSNPPIVDRINAVNNRLKGVRGDISLLLHPSCKHLILDFEQVQPKDGLRIPDKSKDHERTHASDAAGYWIYRKHGIGAFRNELDALKRLSR